MVSWPRVWKCGGRGTNLYEHRTQEPSRCWCGKKLRQGTSPMPGGWWSWHNIAMTCLHTSGHPTNWRRVHCTPLYWATGPWWRLWEKGIHWEPVSQSHCSTMRQCTTIDTGRLSLPTDGAPCGPTWLYRYTKNTKEPLFSLNLPKFFFTKMPRQEDTSLRPLFPHDCKVHLIWEQF